VLQEALNLQQAVLSFPMERLKQVQLQPALEVAYGQHQVPMLILTLGMWGLVLAC